MHVLSLVDNGFDITDGQDKLRKLGDLTFTDETFDFSEVPWQEYNTGDDEKDYGIDKSWIKNKVNELVGGHYQNTVDLVQFCPSPENWHDSDTIGWHLRNTYNDARVVQVKMRDNYDRTMWHEGMHAAEPYIYIYTGIRLETVFGVDYDDGVVHGDHPDWEEYEYERACKIIRPYMNEAIEKDSLKETVGLLEKQYRLLRKLIASNRGQEKLVAA